MSTLVSEKEAQLSRLLQACSEALTVATKERDGLKACLEVEKKASAYWVNESRALRDALEAECGGRCNAEYNPCAARVALTRSKS